MRVILQAVCALALSCAPLSAEGLKPTTRVPDTLRDVPNKVGVLLDYKRGSNGTRVGYCTASVIAQDFILTAAACVIDEAGETRKGVIFAPGNPHTGTWGQGFFEVEEVYVPVSAAGGGDLPARDNIAVAKVGRSDGRSVQSVSGKLSYWGQDSFASEAGYTIGVRQGGNFAFDQLFQEGCGFEIRGPGRRLESTCEAGPGMLGAPVMAYSGDYGFSSIYGVMNASDGRGGAFGAAITRERQGILTDIVSGDPAWSGYGEPWVRKVAEDDYLIRTFAVNTCTRQAALNVAVHFKPLSGDWQTEGFFPVPPNGIALMAESTNRNYYLSAHWSDGRAEIEGDRVRDMPAGGIGRFRIFGVADWGDVFHRAGC